MENCQEEKCLNFIDAQADKDHANDKVSKFVHEGDMSRMAENNRRIFIALLATIASFLINNIVWLRFFRRTLGSKFHIGDSAYEQKTGS